jgi:ribosomal protein S15P/S13E
MRAAPSARLGIFIVARLQKTPVAADSTGVSPFAAFLEPQLEGEIAIHRRHAGAASLQRLETAARPPGAIPAPAPPQAAPPAAEDFERIEDYLRSYLEDEHFRMTHPLACGRWIVSWEMLWCADSRAKVIAVGQRAREAMQAFGSSLLEACAPLAMDPRWPELLAERATRGDLLDAVGGVLDAYGEQLGSERSELLAGLLEHWRALAEHVRRHEQDQQAAAGRLRWEDGRRLVLLTALVMVEVDRSFA